MTILTLAIPDPPSAPPYAPVYGAWQDASGLGQSPLAQITQAAAAGDQVRLETSATPANTTATARVDQVVTLGGADVSPKTLALPLAQVRAVRLGGTTTGLTATVASTNAGGPAGPTGPQGPSGPAGPAGPAGAGGGTLIWQPGRPSAGPSNVYADWSALVAAAPPCASVIVDFTYDQTPTMPGIAATNIYWIGAYLPKVQTQLNPGSPPIVTVLDGATFPDLGIVDDGLQLSFVATTTVPIVRGDGQTLALRNGALIQADPSATLPAIRLTPGNSGANYPYNGPLVEASGSSFLGFQAGDIEVAPLVSAPNVCTIDLDSGAAIGSSSLVSGGSFAGDSSVSLNFLDAEAVYNTASVSAPSIGTLSTSTFGAGLPQYQFGAASSGTSGGSLVAWIPFGNNAALLATTQPPAQDLALANVQGVVTRMGVVLVGSGVGTDDTLVELCYTDTYGGALTPVPGASFTVNTRATGSDGGNVEFADWYPNGRQYGIRLTTQHAVATPFTQIVGFLQ